jgi:hypothetical protein
MEALRPVTTGGQEEETYYATQDIMIGKQKHSFHNINDLTKGDKYHHPDCSCAQVCHPCTENDVRPSKLKLLSMRREA